VLLLQGGVVVRVGEQHRVPAGARLLFDVLREFREEGIGEVGDDQAEREAASRSQGLRGVRGPVPERLHGRLDAGLHGGRHGFRVVEHEGHGGGGDTGLAGHVGHGDSAAGLQGKLHSRTVCLEILRGKAGCGLSD